MAELDVAPAPAADEEDAPRDVSVSAPAAASSDELATVRPPSSIELALDDEAPDTVRRRIEPGPEAIGGARRESGVQPVTAHGSVAAGDSELPAGAEPPSPDQTADAEPNAPVPLDAAAPDVTAPAGEGVEAAADAVAAEPGTPTPVAAAVLEAPTLRPAAEASPSPEAAGDVPEAAAPEAAAGSESDASAEVAAAAPATASEAAAAEASESETSALEPAPVSPAQAEPSTTPDVAADAAQAGATTDVAGAAADSAAPGTSDDFAHEVPPGWIEEGASAEDSASAGDASAAGASAADASAAGASAAAAPVGAGEDDGDVVEEVQASWFEQGADLEERSLGDPTSDTAGAGDAPAADPDEITAGWIEEGDQGERTTPTVPLPAVREPTQPWVDEEADPVTPADRGRSSPLQTADLPLAEDLRGRVLANRFLAEEIAEQSPASITYSAYHLALDSPVTVQVLPRGLACFGEAAELVRQTAVSASMIGSAHIARTLDFGVFGSKDPGFPGGWPYWVAEHVEGKSLARLLHEEGKLQLRRVLALGKQLASGLAAAHAAGIVHGHLKPDCLIVVEPGSRAEVVRILGFGLLHAAGGQLAPPSSSVFGVPFYVSPEQAACRPCDERTDVYALGAILYELMTGRPPFTGGDFAAVLCQHLDDDAASPSELLDLTTGIARGLDEIVLRCLAKDPEQRFASAAELVEVLVGLEQTLGSSKRRPMPEIARPTAMIHSPAPRAESSSPPAPKVIVSAELEAEALPMVAAVQKADESAATPPNSAQPDEAAAGSSRSSRPPEPPSSPGEGSGWWGRLIGRVSVRRPS
jgi:serine/threonine protein kinase